MMRCKRILEAEGEDKMILPIKRCIERAFTKANWDELAYITGGQEIIRRDPRLSKRLHFEK